MTSTWVGALAAALDQRDRAVPFFFRDDDAGWSDERLWALLDVFERYAVPVDLAVIPAALDAGNAAGLLKRRSRSAARVGLHQHGFAHINHEPEGRKHEFGPSRSETAQAADVAQGQTRLHALLGEALDPIFTPPWNRCTQATVEALVASGIEVLSRDATATALELGSVREVPVSIDWCKLRRDGIEVVGREIAARAAGAATVGIMLHHAVMAPEELEELGVLLEALRAHRAARLCAMLDLVGTQQDQQRNRSGS